MKPHLFPFTYVSAPDMANCRCFFQGIKVFQFTPKHVPSKMQAYLDAGLVQPVWPDGPTRLSFETALAETENWAQSHRLGAASYAKGYQDRIPFFDETSVTRIRQEIRKAGQQGHATNTAENKILTAYVFLHMAQVFDIQNQTVAQQMQQQASMEKNLYEDLRGATHLEHLDRSKVDDDPAQFMLLDRIKAWSRVWMAAGDSQDYFITTRQSVITLIQEHLQESEEFISVATVPAIDPDAQTAKAQYQDLGAYCHKLASTDQAHINESGLLDIYSPSSALSDGMQIYLLPGIKPHQLFSRFSGWSDIVEASATNGADPANTVIGLIELPEA